MVCFYPMINESRKRYAMKPFARFDMKVPVKVFPEGEMFISHCPVFDVSSQGDSEEEAKANIVDALTGFIMVCYEMGTIFDVLKEAGFVPGKDEQQNHRERMKSAWWTFHFRS